MGEITAAMVKDLRAKTGAGMMDCKNALVTTNGDVNEAISFLREKGLSAAAKKSGRITAEGLVESYIHAGGKIGVLLEVNCETDFVAKTDDFKELVRDIAMQIAAARPEFVSKDQVSETVIAKERDILAAQAANEGKPEKIIQKMVDGRIEKYYKEVCLLEQPFVKDSDKTVQQLITEKISKIGENISVRRFVRYELGEGLEKRQDDFAAEVMAQAEK